MTDAVGVAGDKHDNSSNRNPWGIEADSAFLSQFSWGREPEIQLSEVAARVLEGIAAGDPTNRLAGRMHLSRQGVEYHVTALLRSMSALNRPSLISRAYSVGLLRPGEWPPRVPPEFVR